jgi:hypothetical protein
MAGSDKQSPAWTAHRDTRIRSGVIKDAFEKTIETYPARATFPVASPFDSQRCIMRTGPKWHRIFMLPQSFFTPFLLSVLFMYYGFFFLLVPVAHAFGQCPI